MDYNKAMKVLAKKEKKIVNEHEKARRKIGFYYSFLTIVLLFCLIQIGYGAILNISKIISYQGKAVTLENLLKQAQLRNEDLKAEKKMVTSDNSLEGIARNNLKMAGQDEVLVIINKKVEKPQKKKKLFNFKNLNFIKHKEEPQEQMPEIPEIPENMEEE